MRSYNINIITILDFLKETIEAVEENNRINNAIWQDWHDAFHILHTYEMWDKFDTLNPAEKKLVFKILDKCIIANKTLDFKKEVQNA